MDADDNFFTSQILIMNINRTLSQVIALKEQMIDLRPRPVLHETEAETSYCETKTKKWSRGHADLETLTSLFLLTQ